MKSIDIIPAGPGFFTVVDLDDIKLFEVGEPVIAWRIETSDDANGDVTSTCMPLTVDGDMVSNCIGIMNPNRNITVFDESNYESLSELQKTKYPSEPN